MIRYFYTTSMLLHMLVIHAGSVPLSSRYPLEEQKEQFLQKLNEQFQVTSDALSICSQFLILRNYDIMRPLLENRNDLLLPGKIYPHPPAVFAIETRNTPLLKVILDIACPRTMIHTDCTQTPPHAAVTLRNTSALREILFPSRTTPSIAEALQHISSISDIVESFIGSRSTPDVLSLTRNSSLFEIALRNNDVEILNLLSQYLRQSYRYSTIPQQQHILQWLHDRCQNLNSMPPQSQYDNAFAWISTGSLFMMLGVASELNRSTINNQQDKSYLAIPSVLLFFGAMTSCMIGCISTRYLRLHNEIREHKQNAIRFYRNLVEHLPR